MAGVVAAVGSDVSDFAIGQRVAVSGAPHASIVTVPVDGVLPIPDGVSFTEASLVMHATIAHQGLRLGRLSHGTTFGMVGLGIIGAITLRSAVAAGGEAKAVVATSRSKEPLARASGATSFLVTTSDGAAIDVLDLPLVFEVMGDPQALSTAVRMAAPGGRIVLLGSSRGIIAAMPVDEIRAKCLTLFGAHVDTIRREAGKADHASARPAEQLAVSTSSASSPQGMCELTIFYPRDRSL